jgi:hypothetical protein
MSRESCKVIGRPLSFRRSVPTRARSSRAPAHAPRNDCNLTSTSCTMHAGCYVWTACSARVNLNPSRSARAFPLTSESFRPGLRPRALCWVSLRTFGSMPLEPHLCGARKDSAGRRPHDDHCARYTWNKARSWSDVHKKEGRHGTVRRGRFGSNAGPPPHYCVRRSRVRSRSRASIVGRR